MRPKRYFLANTAHSFVIFVPLLAYKYKLFNLLKHLPGQTVVLSRKTVDNQHLVDWLCLFVPPSWLHRDPIKNLYKSLLISAQISARPDTAIRGFTDWSGSSAEAVVGNPLLRPADHLWTMDTPFDVGCILKKFWRKVIAISKFTCATYSFKLLQFQNRI